MRSALESGALRTLYLGAHTLARMRTRQLAGICERTARELVVPRLPVDFDDRYERRVPADPPARTAALAASTDTLRDCLSAADRRARRRRARAAAAGDPAFMNRPAPVSANGRLEWDDDRLADQPLQWRLKLYGFEPLADALYGFDGAERPAAVREAFDRWIREWIDAVAVGEGRYLRGTWTPWAVSLRIQRWLRYLASRARAGDDDLDRVLRREIYKNALFLRNHVEWDVDGNHLAENGIALLAAGLAFDQAEWTSDGTTVLETVADEQFLADGCHYERSPMYHVAVLVRLLEAVDLLERSDRPVPDWLWDAADEATTFLRYLRPPDGDIPLLNDAVHGETVPLSACLRYADALGVGAEGRRDDAGPPNGRGAASGYRWLRTDAGALLVDGGPVGPPHLPGHAHSDTLSVLLWVDGRPVVTDTGTFDYAPGARRDYARGVRGHNTVQVGASEPIPIGGRYLMGPRPTPETRLETGPVTLFEGRYEARPLGGARYTHYRAVYAGDDWWFVDDTVAGPVEGQVRSRLHLHPDVDVRRESGGLGVTMPDAPTVRFDPVDAARIEPSTGPYFPRFGEAVERPVATVHAADATSSVGAVVSVGATGEGAARLDADRLRVGSRRYDLPPCRIAPDR